MNKKFVFNWLPPAHCEWPSPSGSALKAFLSKHEIPSHVKYWNILLRDFQNDFWGAGKRPIDSNPIINLLPFVSLIAFAQNDRKSINKVKYELLVDHPQWANMGFDYIEERMVKYANILDQIIDNEIGKMQLDDYFLFGVSSKLSQWIPANVICEKIKKYFPDLPIVIGGFGTREEAMALMKNFNFYDYGIWGEGEYPLLGLCKMLDGKEDMANIPYLIFKNEIGEPEVSSTRKNSFLDFGDKIIPDFDDFVDQHKKDKEKIELTIEGSRGCHWRQCRFCYLNDGYKYREKSIDEKINEMRAQIERHGISHFIFLDNDIIGKDIDSFITFLDRIIELRNEYQDLKISLAEIITKGINHNVVKKMALAGFNHVQIGYESPSNELLKKISKKNSFASNLLFIKWAKYFSMHIGGLNVLTGLLEETDEFIIEGINNLYYFRFFLMKGYFEHNMSYLSIMRSSRYFSELDENKLEDWNDGNFYNILPQSYINKEDRFDIFQFSKLTRSVFWSHFESVEAHLKKGGYEYELIKYNKTIYYREFYNKNLINELEFDNPIHWNILCAANNRVVSTHDIQKSVDMLTNSPEDIYNAIDELKKEGLLYCTEDYSEMVSIINTDLLL